MKQLTIQSEQDRINQHIRAMLPAEVRWLYDLFPYGGRSSHYHIQGSQGSGKSALDSLLIFQDMLLGLPCVVVDPIGTLTDYTLTLILQYLKYNNWDGLELLRRIMLVDMSGTSAIVTETPIYYAHGGETLEQIAMRLIEVIDRLNPSLREAPLHGMPSIEYVGLHAGVLAYVCGFSTPEIIDLLDNPSNWTHRLKHIGTRIPANEVQESVAFFTGPYIEEWSKYSKDARTIAFRQQILHTHFSDNARAQYGSIRRGIDWQEVLKQGKAVFIDLSGETSKRKKRFATAWLLEDLSQLGIIRGRRGRNKRIAVHLDETSVLWQDKQDGVDLNDWLNVRSRNQGLMICGINQESFVVDPVIAKSWLVSPTSQCFGSIRDYDTAIAIAKQLHRYDEHMKQWEDNVWVQDSSDTYGTTSGTSKTSTRGTSVTETNGSTSGGSSGGSSMMDLGIFSHSDSSSGFSSDSYSISRGTHQSVSVGTSHSSNHSRSVSHHKIIDTRPRFHTPEQQWELTANELMGLKSLEFMCKVAQCEGDGVGILRKISLAPYIAAMQPDHDQLDTLKAILVEASGRPVKEILREINERQGIDQLTAPVDIPGTGQARGAAPEQSAARREPTGKYPRIPPVVDGEPIGLGDDDET